MGHSSACFRNIPSVDSLLSAQELNRFPVSAKIKTDVCRQSLDELRRDVAAGLSGSKEQLTMIALNKAVSHLSALSTPSLRRVINATGIILHTNLGRAPLAASCLDAAAAASGFCNLELDLETGKRSSRYTHVESLLCQITGAESALVVNNNAAAVLLTLSALSKNREAIISRGELVEIGGSFRIHTIMEESGALLKEIGSTNRTRISDYAAAISSQTGLLLHVHRSNFCMNGYVETVNSADLVRLGQEHGIPVLSDLGSGCLLPLSELGFGSDPTVSQELAAGIDIVSFSGDKLLGGPQAGLLVGRKKYIDAMKRHPLARALRVDKFTLAALEATLRCYLDPAAAYSEIPLLKMLLLTPAQLKEKASLLATLCASIPGLDVFSMQGETEVGGGSLPGVKLPAELVCLRIPGQDPSSLAHALRVGSPSVVCFVRDNWAMFDCRTLQDGEEEELALIIRNVVEAMI